MGFRLGNDTTARQVTVLVTQGGYLHRAQSLYGKLPQLSRPERSLAVDNPIPSFRGERSPAPSPTCATTTPRTRGRVTPAF